MLDYQKHTLFCLLKKLNYIHNKNELVMQEKCNCIILPPIIGASRCPVQHRFHACDNTVIVGDSDITVDTRISADILAKIPPLIRRDPVFQGGGIFAKDWCLKYIPEGTGIPGRDSDLKKHFRENCAMSRHLHAASWNSGSPFDLDRRFEIFDPDFQNFKNSTNPANFKILKF